MGFRTQGEELALDENKDSLFIEKEGWKDIREQMHVRWYVVVKAYEYFLLIVY
jgi:hypothetical protein